MTKLLRKNIYTTSMLSFLFCVMYFWIYFTGLWVKQIRDAVINGEVKPKEGMPSIRILAKDLAVSVITTKRAYEELEKEGVIESIPGRGFYVCEQKNDHLREKQRMNIEDRLSDLLAECKSAGKRVRRQTCVCYWWLHLYALGYYGSCWYRV